MLWCVYGLIAVAMPSIQYLGALVLACQGVYALLDIRRRWPIIASGVLAALALVPWWWGIKQQWPQAGFAGGQAMTWGWVLARTVLGYALPVDWYRSTQFDVGFSAAALAIFLAGIWLARGGIIGVYAMPALFQAVATAVFHRNLLYGRYLIYLLPAFAIAFGLVAAALLRSKARIVGLLLVASAIVINGVADTNLLVDKFYQLPDWDLVASIVETHERPSDILVFDQRYPYLVMRSSPAVVQHEFRGPERPVEVPPIIRWLDERKNERVWYIENQPQYPDPSLLIKRHLEATRPRLQEWLEPRAEGGNIVFVALYGPVKHATR